MKDLPLLYHQYLLLRWADSGIYMYRESLLLLFSLYFFN